ncbi:MAG: FAD-dependent oxidoreductase [Oscillospiraceae bacterium]|nr:FAD-dependent oxidoreductase [Oscillospiraceae bacterium]
MYDIIIVGGGPAGLTAALYALRAGKTALIIEKNAFGGQITWSPKVENFPTIESISGTELADRLMEQTMNQGAEMELDEVTAIELDGDVKRVKTEFGGEFEAKAVIIATGARPRMLGIEREAELVGSGVCFCAVCDGAFYKGCPVAVNGGGNSALQDAMLLSDTCSRVYLVHRRDSFRGEAKLVEALREKENVEFVLNSSITALHGETELTGITVTDKMGNERKIAVDGLFVAIGHAPDNGIFAELIDLDAGGYADSGEDCMTKTSGVFVAGDCRKKSVRQLTTAAADGSAAALAACSYIDSL